MSWDSWTNNLVQQEVDLCGIHGLKGEPWAQVEKFKCSPEEVARVCQAICTNDQSIYGTGVQLGGKRWTVIQLLQPDELVLKGKDPDNSKQTLVVALSGQAVIFGTSSRDGKQGADVRCQVEKLRDDLKGTGY